MKLFSVAFAASPGPAVSATDGVPIKVRGPDHFALVPHVKIPFVEIRVTSPTRSGGLGLTPPSEAVQVLENRQTADSFKPGTDTARSSSSPSPLRKQACYSFIFRPSSNHQSVARDRFLCGIRPSNLPLAFPSPKQTPSSPTGLDRISLRKVRSNTPPRRVERPCQFANPPKHPRGTNLRRSKLREP